MDIPVQKYRLLTISQADVTVFASNCFTNLGNIMAVSQVTTLHWIAL